MAEQDVYENGQILREGPNWLIRYNSYTTVTRFRSYLKLFPEMGLRESQKSLKWGSRGLLRPPVGVRGLGPLKLKFFLNLRCEKPHFLALYPVSNSHS